MTTSLELAQNDEPLTASPQRQPRGLRVCMLAYAFYESDAPILQYAAALTKRGETVDVVALQRDNSYREFEDSGRSECPSDSGQIRHREGSVHLRLLISTFTAKCRPEDTSI